LIGLVLVVLLNCSLWKNNGKENFSVDMCRSGVSLFRPGVGLFERVVHRLIERGTKAYGLIDYQREAYFFVQQKKVEFSSRE
jgi:hypothetical protein